MTAELLNQGLELTLVGMGTVILFLTILVGATALMSSIVMRIQPDVAESDDAEKVAAIAAAISRHRNRG